MNILIYNGSGTTRVNVLRLSIIAALDFFGLHSEFNVDTVSPETLYDTKWMHTTKLLIIPGGRDLPYVKDLHGKSLHNIRSFIEHGGSYLGLCAGAYFSSSYVLFEKGTDLEVIGKRELALFHGTAKGSVFHPFIYNSTRGSRTVSLCIEQKDNSNETSYAYFNGGCEFLPDAGFINFKTMATYKDYPGKRAIISRDMGKGKIILCGVHPEMDIKFLDESEYSPDKWFAMKQHSAEQRVLFQSFMKYLLGINESLTENIVVSKY